MNLTYEQIRSIAWGADRVELIDGYFRFFRFTKEQELLYFGRNRGSYDKTVSAAGVKLVFKTNSETLGIDAVMEGNSTRQYISFDVFVDGKLLGYLDNCSEVELPADYTEIDLPIGKFQKTFDLGKGEKTVSVYLPWNCILKLVSVSVDDGAFVTPVKPEKQMLVFGDSITQGYDSVRPSNHYAVKLADALGAEMRNKAIGGEEFLPELVTTGENCEFDYITVAYGTNDWSHGTREKLIECCRGFYVELSKKYPTAKIFAVGPIWRKDMDIYKPYGKFMQLIEDIKSCTAGLDNVVFIDGFDFVPKDEKYFADLRLHPNDEGFAYYFENLYKAIKEYI